MVQLKMKEKILVVKTMKTLLSQKYRTWQQMEQKAKSSNMLHTPFSKL